MFDDGKTSSDSVMNFGGNIPGANGRPAFELGGGQRPCLPVLIAVPHAGRVYPASLLETMRDPDESCLRLEDRHVDIVARAVAASTGAALITANAPRAMIDLNRAPDDMDWDMVQGGPPGPQPRHAAGRRARSGLGLVPRRLAAIGELWNRRIGKDELAERVAQVHQPYHYMVGHMLESLRDEWGAAILLDLHSMPPLGQKTGPDQAPDFVVGDRFGVSCAATLSAVALQHLRSTGRPVAHNRPYAGGYVLDRHGAPARHVHALQLEVCRAAYLDADLRDPGPGLDSVAEIVSTMIRRLAEALPGARGFAQAAE